MTKRHRVLVVDDEPAIRRLLAAGLAAEGYAVVSAATGRAAIEQVRQDAPDVVILDLGLPDLDGVDVIRNLRRFSAVPVIVLSVRSDEKAKVAALDLGADDYVTKPFGMEELVARIRTALRHRMQERGESHLYRQGDLTVDLVRRVVSIDGKPVKLTAKEFDLLRLFVTQSGRVLTHRYILRQIWGPANEDDVQYLRVYVRALREKLERDPTRPDHILTETGVGYRLRAPDEEAKPARP
ncbi:MAG: response regulator transcription factor [Alphaproteobacteria bacterium]